MAQIVKNRLKELRERSRLTLDEVAKLTDFDKTTVSKHETGNRSINEDAINKYAKLYKVQTHELFFVSGGSCSSEEIEEED